MQAYNHQFIKRLTILNIYVLNIRVKTHEAKIEKSTYKDK